MERSDWASRAEREIARIKKARAEAADEAFGRIEAKARGLAARRDFDGALEVARSAPEEELVPLLGGRLEKLAGELRASAEETFKTAFDAARARLAAGRPEEGLEALKVLQGVRYAAREKQAAEFAALLRKATADAGALRQAQRLAAAQTAFEKTLAAFDEALKADLAGATGAFARVRKLARDAARDEKLKLVAEQVAALAGVVDALDRIIVAQTEALRALKDGRTHTFVTKRGKVSGVVREVTVDEIVLWFKEGPVEGERRVKLADLTDEERARLRGGFKPATPAEHLAKALCALGAADFGAAAEAFVAAKEHPFAERYARRFAALRLGARETAAQALLKEFEAACKAKQPKKIIELGEAFLAEHGETECGEKNAAEVKKLVAGAQQAIAPTQRYEVVFRQGAPVPELWIAEYGGTADTSLSPKDPNLAGPERGMGGGSSLTISFDKKGEERRSVIRFDLARIPRTAKVEKALLSLYCRTGAKGTVGVYRVANPWEASAKSMEWDTGASWTFASGSGGTRKPWATPGGDFDVKTDWGQGAGGLVCAPVVYRWKKRITFDLTPLVQAWVSGKMPNHGVLLKPENWPEKKPAYLHSADTDEAETRPALEVTFTGPRVAPAPPP